MSLARSFHLVQIALLPSVLIAACQAVPPDAVPAAASPSPAVSAPAASPSDAPTVPGALARQLTLRILMPAGTYTLLHGLRTQAAVTEEEVSAGTLRGLVYVVGGRVLQPNEFEVLGADWDEAGRIVVRVKLLSPPSGDVRVSVATPDGGVTLLGDAPANLADGTVTLDLETTARALVSDRLKAAGIEPGKASDDLVAIIQARLANLLAAPHQGRLLEAPSLNTALGQLVEALASGKDPAQLTAPGVVDPIAVGPGGGGTSTPGTITLSSTALSGGAWALTASAAGIGGGGQSPQFGWSTFPGTQSYTLIVEDTTTPAVHWLAYNLPSAVTALMTDAGIPGLGGLLGLNALTPTPTAAFMPFAVAGHIYRATLYALDVATLSVPTVPPDVIAVRAAMSGHVLASGTLSGAATGGE